ncbi:hypothetical protein RND81_01G201800 [Saponaria officinalis]|uniref:Uncharacterized protein n=1 Tax=Saponaria officinalis TaxID=3572 RepID=A0AAW1NB85_SAPOF
MGGKGQKRRAKNYLNSHGGDKRLPPPPNTASIDALPSKLRKLMSFTSSLGNEVNAESAAQLNGKNRNAANKKSQSDAQDESKSMDINAKMDKMSAMLESEEKKKKKKKKRTRKEVNDLRFEAEMEKLGVISKRKQRKKEFLKNKKKKQKKGASEQTQDLPKRDEVKFGEVVQAPPKLDVVPKAPKKPMNASTERLRLQAIEAYRNRRGTNRLGIQLPSLSTSSELE